MDCFELCILRVLRECVNVDSDDRYTTRRIRGYQRTVVEQRGTRVWDVGFPGSDCIQKLFNVKTILSILYIYIKNINRKIRRKYNSPILQFDVHPLVLTIQMDMADKRKLPVVIVWAFFSKIYLFFSTYKMYNLIY